MGHRAVETAELQALAGALPGDRPVCAGAGEGWNAGFYDQARRFAAGAALIAVCESCQHTVLRAVLRDRPDARADTAAEDLLGQLPATAGAWSR